MDIVTLDQLSLMSGVAPNDNMRSVHLVINQYGWRFGLDQLQRVAQMLAQVLHEGGNFRYDREVWGPTPAQQRYDTRTDLGNTPEVDGDGERNSGRGPIQVTGGDNLRALTRWIRSNIDPNAPDFFENPDLINTDPWEGLSIIWYWSTRKLNDLADSGDNEQISKKINGGFNGLEDRLRKYVIVGLVLLGFKPNQVREFQIAAKAKGLYTAEIDGDPGPKTRSAMHLWLAQTKPGGGEKPLPTNVQAGPVVVEKEVETPVPVAPAGAEKSGSTWLNGLLAFVAANFAAFMDMPWQAKVAIITITALSLGFLIWRGEIIARRVKAVLKEFAT